MPREKTEERKYGKTLFEKWKTSKEEGGEECERKKKQKKIKREKKRRG